MPSKNTIRTVQIDTYAVRPDNIHEITLFDGTLIHVRKNALRGGRGSSWDVLDKIMTDGWAEVEINEAGNVVAMWAPYCPVCDRDITPPAVYCSGFCESYEATSYAGVVFPSEDELKCYGCNS